MSEERQLDLSEEAWPSVNVDLNREVVLAIIDLMMHPYYRARLLKRNPGDIREKLEKAEEILSGNPGLERINLKLNEYDVSTIGSEVYGEFVRNLPERTVLNEYGYPKLDKDIHAYAFLDLYAAYEKVGGAYWERNETRSMIEQIMRERDG